MATAVVDRKSKRSGAVVDRPEAPPEVRRAEAMCQQAKAQLEAADAETQRCVQAVADADAALDAPALIRGRAALDTARAVRDVQARVLERAQEQYRDAIAAANRAKVAPLRERLIAEIRGLEAELRRAEERNRKVVALQDEAVALGRDASALTGVAFVPFNDGSAGTGLSRLDAWRRHVASQLGIIDF